MSNIQTLVFSVVVVLLDQALVSLQYVVQNPAGTVLCLSVVAAVSSFGSLEAWNLYFCWPWPPMKMASVQLKIYIGFLGMQNIKISFLTCENVMIMGTRSQFLIDIRTVVESKCTWEAHQTTEKPFLCKSKECLNMHCTVLLTFKFHSENLNHQTFCFLL